MVEAWGVELARGFFARCCPMLLELGAIAYWSMDLRRTPEVVQRTVGSVTQCMLCLDRHSVRIMKAEGREPSVTGSLLHRDSADADPVVTEAEVIERVAASLRAVRRPRNITQQKLAELAGVTASAISQAERAERGLSLATLVRLSSRLGVTLDELLRGDDPSTYRIGRRVGDPRLGPDREMLLVGGLSSDVAIDLVHLGPREAGAPREGLDGRAIIAVSRGLVQIGIGDQTPAIRDGEVLLTDRAAVRDWRNLGDREAVLFWIVVTRRG
jgi:transcriptional regulator with XRE-family HTH domain